MHKQRVDSLVFDVSFFSADATGDFCWPTVAEGSMGGQWTLSLHHKLGVALSQQRQWGDEVAFFQSKRPNIASTDFANSDTQHVTSVKLFFFFAGTMMSKSRSRSLRPPCDPNTWIVCYSHLPASLGFVFPSYVHTVQALSGSPHCVLFFFFFYHSSYYHNTAVVYFHFV